MSLSRRIIIPGLFYEKQDRKVEMTRNMGAFVVIHHPGPREVSVTLRYVVFTETVDVGATWLLTLQELQYGWMSRQGYFKHPEAEKSRDRL